MPAPSTPYKPYADRFPNNEVRNSPTALEVVKDAGAIGKLTDKVILITGCTAGLGVETAKALHVTGAKLYIAGRNVAKGEQVVKDIIGSSDNNAPVEFLQIDLSSLKSVRSAAKEFLSKEKKLNILINNAGGLLRPCR